MTRDDVNGAADKVARIAAIEQIEANSEAAPKVGAANRIVVNFPNDHDIGGMAVEIVNVTPEQIAIATFHLMRSADQLADLRQMQQAQSAGEIAAMRRQLETRRR